MGLKNIINELAVSNISDSISFYEKYFGFSLDFTDGDPVIWAQLKKDNFILMLEDYNALKSEISILPGKTNNSNIIMFEFDSADEIKEISNLLKENNIKFFIDYHETEYGKVECGVLDLDNNMIIMSSSIG